MFVEEYGHIPFLRWKFPWGGVSLFMVAGALLVQHSSLTLQGPIPIQRRTGSSPTNESSWLKLLSSSAPHHGLEATALGEPLLAGSCEGEDKEQPARQGRFFKKPNSFHLKPVRKAESSGNICGLRPIIVSGMKNGYGPLLVIPSSLVRHRTSL